MYCRECGVTLAETARFCFKCGARQSEKETLAEAKLKCAACNTKLETDWILCPRCGKKVENAVSSTEPSSAIRNTSGNCQYGKVDKDMEEDRKTDSVSTKPYIIDDCCVSCACCVQECPVAARSETSDGKIKIDNSCTGCGVCVSACPVEAIVYRDKSGNFGTRW